VPNADPPAWVPAILLAAGASRRMGTPKALLPCPPSGEPLVRRTARVLREGGATAAYVVVRPGGEGDAIAEAVSGLDGISVVVNPSPERGMLSSVQAGVRAAIAHGPPDWFLVSPCDLPRLEPGSVKAVLDMVRHSNARIVVPVYEGVRGHPTAFRGNLAAEALALVPETHGLNELLKRWAGSVAEAAVTVDGAVRDADTPEEWRDLTGAGHERRAIENDGE